MLSAELFWLIGDRMAASRSASSQPASQTIALYANVGPDLTHYDLDIAGAELIKRETITLPAGVPGRTHDLDVLIQRTLGGCVFAVPEYIAIPAQAGLVATAVSRIARLQPAEPVGIDPIPAAKHGSTGAADDADLGAAATERFAGADHRNPVFERAIAAIFDAEPDNALTTEELCGR